MIECDLDSAIPDWIVEHPETLTVFNRHAIDCSCGGKSLRYVCQTLGLDPAEILQELVELVEGRSP